MIINRPKKFFFRLLSLATLLLFMTGCATTRGGYDTQQSQDERLTSHSQQPLQNSHSLYSNESQVQRKNIAELFRLGKDAYRDGNFDRAEKHFREVVRIQPRHSRATYNLSMIYLQRAYEGLKHFTRLESSDSQRRIAKNWIEHLDSIEATN